MVTCRCDESMPPFDQLRGVHRLAPERSGRASWAHARHQLYAARHKTTRANVLVKLTSKPGVVYEKDLANEIATTAVDQRGAAGLSPLSGADRPWPAARRTPVPHGIALRRVAARDDDRRVAGPVQRRVHLKTMIEATRVVADLHAIQIWHVDLNPINILARWQAAHR
jgi:hypothetical protein